MGFAWSRLASAGLAVSSVQWPADATGTIPIPNPWRISVLLRSIWPKNVASNRASGLTGNFKGTSSHAMSWFALRRLRWEVLKNWQHSGFRRKQLIPEKATVWHKGIRDISFCFCFWLITFSVYEDLIFGKSRIIFTNALLRFPWLRVMSTFPGLNKDTL